MTTKPTEFTIELVREDKASLVGELICELLAELEPGYRIDRFHYIEVAKSLLHSCHELWAFLALDDESNAVGVIVLNECAAIYAGGTFGEITELYVRPDCRSKGIASALIHRASELGHVRGWKRLEVGAPDRPQWERTIRFYAREGFQEIGPRLRREFVSEKLAGIDIEADK